MLAQLLCKGAVHSIDDTGIRLNKNKNRNPAGKAVTEAPTHLYTQSDSKTPA